MQSRLYLSIGRVNKKFLIDEEFALVQLTYNPTRQERMTFWGVLDSWRTVTTEQAAAFTGVDYLINPEPKTVAASFALGLINTGSFPTPLQQEPGMNSRPVRRPSNTEVYKKLIHPTLTWPETIQVTSGFP